MQNRSRTAMILLTLAISVIVIVLLLTTVFAAMGSKISGSTTIKFVTEEQIQKAQEELDNLMGKDSTSTGLEGKVNNDGTLTMTKTQTASSIGSDTLKTEHDNLIKQGILRYAIYQGTICKAVNEKDGPMLIVILDFSNHNISKLSAGFLNGLAYTIVGSHSFLGMAGASFVERNYDFTENGTTYPKTFSIYNSTTPEGSLITTQTELHLEGIYSQEKENWWSPDPPSNSYMQEVGSSQKTYINQYSVRIILPNNESVTLEKDSLKIQGVETIGSYSILSPNCVAVGVSHLDLLPNGNNSNGAIKWNKNIILEPGVVANKNHFHWMTTTGYQMDYALARSLDAMLGLVYEPDENGIMKPVEVAQGKLDEIFRKNNVDSDFSRLFISIYKPTDVTNSFNISIYGEPEGTVSEHSTKGIFAAIRMMYWLQEEYHLEEKKPIDKTTGEKIEVKFQHYTRSAKNELTPDPGISPTPATLDYYGTKVINNEICYGVKCSHHEEINGGIIGYFSPDGDVYLLDESGNPYLYQPN